MTSLRSPGMARDPPTDFMQGIWSLERLLFLTEFHIIKKFRLFIKSNIQLNPIGQSPEKYESEYRVAEANFSLWTFSNIQPILRIQGHVIWRKNGNFCRLEEFLCFLKKNPCFWSKIKSMAKWPLSGLKWQIENAIWNFKKN